MNQALMQHSELRIQAGSAWLDAWLTTRAEARGLILCIAPRFAQLRDSREDTQAGLLREAGFATLLVSLLTPHEAQRSADLRYDIALLDQRLQALLTWVSQQPALGHLPVGLLATDTVAAASIRLLAREPGPVAALISRAGRCDLAGAQPLRRLALPLLMLVPAAEPDFLAPSEQAYALIGAPKAWQLIPAADAGFSQPGTLEAASRQACQWFEQHLPVPSHTPA